MNVAIIDTNEISYDYFTIRQSNFTQDKIHDKLDEFISFKYIEDEKDLMNFIIAEIVYDNKLYNIHNGIVSHILDELYLIFHINMDEDAYINVKSNKEEYNGIASYLSDQTLKVYKKAIIIKMNTSNNKYVNINLDNIITLFINKFVHTGIIINIDKSIEEYTFIHNPIDTINPNDFIKYKYDELEILGCILMLFYDTSSDIINEVASNLDKQKNIYGRVFVGLRHMAQDLNDNNMRYVDIYKNTFIQITDLLNSNQSIKLTNIETIGYEFINNKPIYNNFHKILYNRNKL